MTKNEFVAKRLKDESRTYAITIPVLAICVLAAVALSIAGLVMGKGVMSLGPALIMASIALRIPLMIQERKNYEIASEELAARMADPNAPLSETTENLIDRFENRSAKELKQASIAYLIMGVMLTGMGIFLFVLLTDPRFNEDNIFLTVILPIIMAGMGVFLLLYGWKAFRDYRTARDLQEMDE